MSENSHKELEAMRIALDALSGLETKEEQERSLEWIAKKLGITPAGLSATLPPLIPQPEVQPIKPTAPTSREFMAEKKPKDNVMRVTCLAYYLHNFRNQPKFKCEDIEALNTDAAGPTNWDIAKAISNATRPGYLASAGHGYKQITPRGEEVVKRLPDEEAVRQFVKEQTPTRRRKKITSKRKSEDTQE